MIRAILFDLDETLVDRTETMRRFLFAQHERFPELSDYSGATFSSACLKYQDNGYADKLSAYDSVCEELGLADSKVPGELFADFKERYGADAVLFPNVVETLRLLRSQYRIGLVSNGRTKGQMAKIESFGIKALFSSICISESFGCKKPDPAIFRACLEELSVKPEEAVFVGDNPLVDIEPAKKIGMFAVWVKNSHFPAPAICDSVITSIEELPVLVSELG